VASRAHAAFSVPEIAIQLMSYLQPEHILVCLRVCRAWKAIFELELWANVVLLPPPVSPTPTTVPRENLSYVYRRNVGRIVYGISYYAPLGPEVRYVNWWCKPSGSSKIRLASSDTGSLICQSCNHLLAEGLNYWDLHLTLASHHGGREDAGGDMRRRVIGGGGGRWMVFRRMTPEQWKERGPLIRSLTGMDVWDKSLATAVAKYCGREGGGILQHLEMEISKPSSKPLEQLLSLSSFFSAFAVKDGSSDRDSGGGGTLTSVSVQFCDREASLRLLLSLRGLTSLRTLEIRGLVNWREYSLANKDEMAEGGGEEGGGPTAIQCRVEDLLGVVAHACPDLETLRLSKLLIEEQMTTSGDGNNNNHCDSSTNNKDNQRSLLFPEIQSEGDLTLYRHTNLKRLILQMPWGRRRGGGGVYQPLFRAFSHLNDLDLTVVNTNYRQQGANETLAEILQHSG